MELIEHFDDRADLTNHKYDQDNSQEHDPNVREWDNDEATDSDRQRVYDLLSTTSVGIDELIRQSEISTSTVQLILLELELAGKISRHAGGKVSLKN